MERDLTPEAAERLLSGAAAPPGTEELAAVLSAASAPARPNELAGEADAMAAFRAHPPAVTRWSLRRALAVKVVAAVAVTVAAGGVAVASGAGLLPNPFHPSNVDGSPSSAGTPSKRPDQPGQSSSPSPSLEVTLGLCQAYEAIHPGERARALQSPPLSALSAAAGGPEKVPGYCAKLPNEAKDPKDPKDPKESKESRDPRPAVTPAHPMPPTPLPTSPRTRPSRTAQR